MLGLGLGLDRLSSIISSGSLPSTTLLWNSQPMSWNGQYLLW